MRSSGPPTLCGVDRRPRRRAEWTATSAPRRRGSWLTCTWPAPARSGPPPGAEWAATSTPLSTTNAYSTVEGV